MPVKKYLLLFVLLFTILKLPAQLCKGSLGDPIINITFGSGPNPGPPLSTTKNLNYLAIDCPNDGFYTVRNRTANCFSSSWHSLSNDHTGDANGYFMLINASIQKSEFYIDTLKGLCPSTTYEFAAWVLNIILPSACGGTTIKPNLTFNIEKTDGTVLQTYNTGDIAPTQDAEWNQYGSFFTTPAGVTNVVLRLLNNSTGGCGNDIAIDDITFRPCGPQLSPSVRGGNGATGNVCVGNDQNVTLDCAVSAGYNNPAYQWQQSVDGGSTWTDIPGENATSMVRHFSPSAAAGDYLYRLTVAEAGNINLTRCRIASSVLTITVNNKPSAAITTNSPVCQGTSINLSASGAAAGETYNWSGPRSFSGTGSAVAVVNAQPSNAGKYYLQVTSAKGCRQSDSTTIVVTPAPVVTMAFNNRNICDGDSVLLGSSGTGAVSYQWKPAAGLSSAVIANPIARPSVSTVYKVVATNAAGCAASDTVAVNVMSKPVANAGPDKAVVEGQSVQLEGSVNGGNAVIIWSPNLSINDVHSLQPVVTPAVTTNYILSATSADGCGSSSDSANVHVYKHVVIPNAFSPNGDGINDKWNITALSGYDNYELSVFNRYGSIVLSTRNYDKPWDGTSGGKDLPVGTYYYVLDLKLSLPKLTGFVVILR